MSVKKLTVAFAGLGSRGNAFAEACEVLKDKIEIVACADVDAGKLQRFGDKYGVPAEMRFGSAEEMLERERLAEVMFICTMDKQHFGHAIPALNKDYHLVLEKPASTDPKECVEIARVANEREREVIVCHVLRYTPFYRKIKEIMDSGALGKIYSIEATESVTYWHQAHSFVRGNWRNSNETSPMILQKSCHDMDILLWLTGKHCQRVSSFGSLSHFKKECAPEGAPERCSEACPAYANCPYSIERYLHHKRLGCHCWPLDVVSPETDYEKYKADLLNSQYARCVYHCDNNVVDHQVVNLLLDEDLTITFSMCAFTSDDVGRTIHVMGTHGDLYAKSSTNEIKLTRFCGGMQESEDIECRVEYDSFGHGGGDYGLVLDLIGLFDGSGAAAVTSINDSVESHVVALAAEKSRVLGGELIKIGDYVKSLDME